MQVSTLTDVVRLDTSHDHTCALVDTGAAYCFGNGDSGALGLGNELLNASVPVLVFDSEVVAELRLGAHNTCLRTASDAVWCWGQNRDGELGDLTTMDQLSPVNITSLPALIPLSPQ